MIATFNDRVDPESGSEYFAGDFQPGPAQEAGLSLPRWFQFPEPRLVLPEFPTFEAFSHLLAGRLPDGSARLTQRTNTTRLEAGRSVSNRRTDYELTFSAVKAASIAALAAGDRRILPAFEFAVLEAIRLASEFAAVRVRKNRENFDRTTGHVVGVVFFGIESREGDCQLHGHAAFFNVTWDPVERHFKALQFQPILDHILLIRRWAGALFHHALLGLGYQTQETDLDVELVGISRAAELAMSKQMEAIRTRRREIEKKEKRLLFPHVEKIVGLGIRKAKKRETWSAMQARWHRELAPYWPQIEKTVAAARARSPQRLPRDKAVAAAWTDQCLDRLLENYTRVSTGRLLAEVLEHADGRWHGEDARNVIADRLRDGTYLAQDKALTTPQRAAVHAQTVLAAYAARHCAHPVGLPSIGQKWPNDALQLLDSAVSLSLVFTGSSREGKNALRDFVAQLRLLKQRVVIAFPRAVSDDPTVPVSQTAADILLVGRAERLTQAELDALVSLAATGRTRILFCTSRQILKPCPYPTVFGALARHRWHQVIDLSQTPLPNEPRTREFQDIPRRLVSANRDREKALSDLSASVSAALRSKAPVQVWTDTPSVIDEMNVRIHRQLEDHTGSGTSITVFSPRASRMPRVGDRAISAKQTRHFEKGECLEVLAVDPFSVLVERDGWRGTQVIAWKVWNKLKPVTTDKIELFPGAMLTVGESLPGMKRLIAAGETVQVRSVASEGALHLTDNRTIPASFRFFRLGYCAPLPRKVPKSPARIVVFLRKRPKRATRKLLHVLARENRLEALVVRSRRHFEEASHPTQLTAHRQLEQQFKVAKHPSTPKPQYSEIQ